MYGEHFLVAFNASMFRLALGGGQPALYDASGQRRVTNSAALRHLLKSVQIVSVKPQSDLLSTSRPNLEVKVLKLIAKLLDAVAIPELTFGAIAGEPGKLALLVSHLLPPPLPRRQAR
jgi:hypothetical protein